MCPLNPSPIVRHFLWANLQFPHANSLQAEHIRSLPFTIKLPTSMPACESLLKAVYGDRLISYSKSWITTSVCSHLGGFVYFHIIATRIKQGKKSINRIIVLTLWCNNVGSEYFKVYHTRGWIWHWYNVHSCKCSHQCSLLLHSKIFYSLETWFPNTSPLILLLFLFP